jgi:hypothetical protein
MLRDEVENFFLKKITRVNMANLYNLLLPESDIRITP